MTLLRQGYGGQAHLRRGLPARHGGQAAGGLRRVKSPQVQNKKRPARNAPGVKLVAKPLEESGCEAPLPN